MTTQIHIEVAYGNAEVTDDDIERAETAALGILNGIDPDTAYAEYQRQWEVLDSHNGMTGLASLWIEAQQAADIALTEGWARPDGAGCFISA